MFKSLLSALLYKQKDKFLAQRIYELILGLTQEMEVTHNRDREGKAQIAGIRSHSYSI